MCLLTVSIMNLQFFELLFKINIILEIVLKFVKIAQTISQNEKLKIVNFGGISRRLNYASERLDCLLLNLIQGYVKLVVLRCFNSGLI